MSQEAPRGEAATTRDVGAGTPGVPDPPDAVSPDPADLVVSLVVAGVVGGGVAYAGRESALALLVAVAVLQALVGVAWIWGTALPGRRGAFTIGALAAAGADVTTSLFPHGRLGALLVVFGLAVPVMFVHQLARGTARTRLVTSLSSAAVLVVLLVAPASLFQLRHEFVLGGQGGQVVAAAVAAIAAPLVIGCLVDLVLPVPRFDPHVPRGLLAVAASVVIGAVVSDRLLESVARFPGGRAAYVGAALGALAGLATMAASFVLFDVQQARSEAGGDAPKSQRDRVGTAVRPALPALVALTLVAPAAYLLCLALRT